MDHGDPEVFLHEHLPRLARYAAVLTRDRKQAHEVTVERAASCVCDAGAGVRRLDSSLEVAHQGL